MGAPGLPGGAPHQPAGQKEKGESAEPADTETRKAVNDAVAYIRGLAELNGRNADWAAEAVRTAVSLPASEALKLNVIDVIADDVPDLLRQIDGRVVKVAGKSERLATAGLEVVTAAPDWRTELLAVITDPTMTDVDPAEIGKNKTVDVAIIGDVRSSMKTMIKILAKKIVKHNDDNPWLRRRQELVDYYTESIKDYPRDLTARKVLKKLRQTLPSEAIVTTEVGQCQMWTSLHFDVLSPGTFFSSTGLGTMGFGFRTRAASG